MQSCVNLLYIRNMQMYKFVRYAQYVRDACGVDKNLPARFHTRDSAVGARKNKSGHKGIKKSC